ncbi:hypothetical protein OF855_24455 [Mycolicibacterium fortuitum]|uniref:hypothetical protein n=1 Tax=Mycolicibacterium fortuitum TaxID=1766 RepID=UPI0022BA4F23|nr:hypothetical protein [Mycolicibacterium fortuitum]WAY18392.1 hypothetical protein OF855_24455 [Mycolicibacterium fortuitum]
MTLAIHVDVYTRLHDREIRRDAQQLERTFDQTGRNMGDNLSAGVERATPKVEKSLARVEKATDKVADAMGNVSREQAKYDDLVARGDVSRAKLIDQSERLARAKRNEQSAVREAARAHRDHNRDLIDASSIAADATNAIGNLTNSAGGATSAFKGLKSAVGPAAAGIAAVGGTFAVAQLADLAKVAVTASQSLWLLPAAAAAAATGFAALKIGTLGFADAIESIRDPEKFATALQSLSPNAQQAALSIQSLLPQFDALKNSVQDSLFANVAGTIQQLATQFMPMLQTSLSGVASAFNTAFQGVASALSNNPELISGALNNIEAAFRNLAPAAQPFTEALLKIVNVGSTFLPKLGDAVADAANKFATFITDKAASGELQQWITDGINAVKELGSTIWDIGKIIADTFGSSKPEEFRDTLGNVVTAVNFVAGAIIGMSDAWNSMAEGARVAVNGAITAINTLLGPIRTAIQLLNLLPGNDIPLPGLTPLGAGVPAPGTQGGGGLLAPRGVGTSSGVALSAVTAGGRAGMGVGSTSTPWTQMAVPAAPGDGSGRRGGPHLPDAPVVAYDPTVPGGSSPATFSQETSFLDARQKLAEKRARLDQLEKSSVATEQDRLKARNDVVEAERDLQGAEIRLNEARNTQYQKMIKAGDQYSRQMGEIGAQLDQDFGISKGLVGIAENITKFVANLAAAPLLGQLDAISQVNPSKGGYGAMGIAAAQGAFGPQYTGIDYSKYGYGVSAMGPAALRGSYPGDAALLSNVPAGRYTQTQGADLTQGLADCSSSVEDLVNLLDGRPTGGRSMSTGNAAEWLTSRGFMPGMGGPGDFRVGYNSGHMQATLPGGTPFNWGSDAAAARGGIGGTGAYDPSLTSHYYRPAGVTSPAPSVADIYGPANTNPALTPAAPSLAGVPSMPGGMMPGMGAPSAAPFANTQYGGITPAGGSGQGGVGMSGGGALGMAMDAGGMALDLMAPGAGQAAQTGIKLANRAIQYGGQVAGIGAQGLMETFLPFGASELANNNWLTRIVGGLAGAAPAIPNAAGKSSQPTADQVANVDPNTTQHGQGANPGPGNTYNVQIDAANREPQGIAKDFEWHTSQANAGPGMG